MTTVHLETTQKNFFKGQPSCSCYVCVFVVVVVVVVVVFNARVVPVD